MNIEPYFYTKVTLFFMAKTRPVSLLLPLTILADSLCMNTAFFLSYFIRFNTLDGVLLEQRFILFLVFNASWVIVLLLFRPYREPRTTFNLSKLTYNFLLILLIHAAIIAFYWVYSKGYAFSRLRLAYIYIISAVLGISLRIIAVLLLRYLRQQGYNIRNYIVVGIGELSASIVEYYAAHPEIGYVFKGFFDNNPKKTQNIYDIKDIESFVIENKIDFIYCCTPYLSNNIMNEIISISQKHDSHVKLLMNFSSFSPKEISVEYHDHIPVFNLSQTPHFDRKAMFIKRSFDLIFATSVLVLGSPIFLLLALITKLSSPGPILYRSERVGMWGKKFQMLKFRSMYVNADEIANKLLGGKMHSTGDTDPRITSWGRFMRKTRLDELPQFLNVLLGDISVVGPRPLAQYDVDMLMESHPDSFNRILSIKPGITSVGQLKIGYATTKEENIKRMNYDLMYLKKYSFRTDISLIFLTARVMIQKKGK